MNIKLTLKGVRLAFSDNMTVTKSIGGGKPRYTANFIFENVPGELKKAKDAIAAITKAEFDSGKALTGDDLCLRDGNDNVSSKTNEVYEGFAGNFYLAAARAESQGPPLIVNGRLDPVRPGEAGFPHAGDYVNVIVNVYSQNGKGDKKNAYGRKINCSFETVQFARKGESFGGGTPPSTEGLEPEEADEIDAI